VVASINGCDLPSGASTVSESAKRGEYFMEVTIRGEADTQVGSVSVAIINPSTAVGYGREVSLQVLRR
jgi:hypothetical protein